MTGFSLGNTDALGSFGRIAQRQLAYIGPKGPPIDIFIDEATWSRMCVMDTRTCLAPMCRCLGTTVLSKQAIYKHEVYVRGIWGIWGWFVSIAMEQRRGISMRGVEHEA